MLRAAIERGVDRVLVGLGGSATTDLGLGMATALGWKFLDASGSPLDFGEPRMDVLRAMERIRRVDSSDVSLPGAVEVIGLADVDTPVFGARGSVALFGAQKGISGVLAPRFEAALEHAVAAVREAIPGARADEAGAGAAGGLGFGLVAFAGATLVPGARLVADLVGLADACGDADLVITGEGRLDVQTAHSKVVTVVADVARCAGVPRMAVIAGSVGSSPGSWPATLGDVIDASEGQAVNLERDGEARLRNAVGRLAARLRDA